MATLPDDALVEDLAWSTEALRLAFALGAWADAHAQEDPDEADAFDALIETDGATIAGGYWTPLMVEVAGVLGVELAERLTLESCDCGEHFYCPDGYHANAEMPCACTADCAREGVCEECQKGDHNACTGPPEGHEACQCIEDDEHDA